MATGLPRDFVERWQTGAVLKRDVFSTVEQGKLSTPDGVVDAVLRRTDQVPWWSWPLARILLWRERKALRVVGPMGVGPRLLAVGNGYLVRSWIDGAPLNIQFPDGEPAYFKSAKATLRRMRRDGLCHNDLAKPPNWLRGNDGRAYVVDFQLAIHFRRRHKLFRVLAYEDLRHLLKYKRMFAPELMTPKEWQVVGRKSAIGRVWMATGKKVYMLITRGVLQFSDHEGLGPRFVHDARRLTTALKTHELVHDVAIVGYPLRDKGATRDIFGTALHAFVEAKPGLTEQSLRELLAGSNGPQPPERIQLVDALPRDDSGQVRIDILRLIALQQGNQAQLMASESQRETVARIVAGQPALAESTAR